MKSNKTRIIIDTNIFVRGWIFQSEYPKVKQMLDNIMELMSQGVVELVFSQDTIGELMYIMKNKVIHYIENEEEQLNIINSLATLFFYSYSVNTENTKLTETINDPKDIMFVKCATQGNAKYIVSDDFKSGMHNIKNIRVVGSNVLISYCNLF